MRYFFLVNAVMYAVIAVQLMTMPGGVWWFNVPVGLLILAGVPLAIYAYKDTR